MREIIRKLHHLRNLYLGMGVVVVGNALQEKVFMRNSKYVLSAKSQGTVVGNVK